MKKYEIEINGETYRVTVKELATDAEITTETAASEQAEPSTPRTQPSPTDAGTGVDVNAPMPGTIMNINVAPGDSVTQGDVLMILEAMKMENEIIAPTDGVVADILVNVNDSVKSDQLLLKM